MEKKNYADVLESYTIAEEGIFAKFKERRERKKAAKKKKEEALATFEEYGETDLKLVKNIATNVINKAKSGYSDLPWKVKFKEEASRDGLFVEVTIFENEDCLNEESDSYSPRAVDRFEFIFNEIQKQCIQSNAFKNKIEVEIMDIEIGEEHTIMISILADY